MMKSCIACGMPMREPKDFAMGNRALAYCHYCQRQDGTMKTFDEKKADLIALVIHTQGLNPTVAEQTVLSMMKKLPAWAEVC